MGTALASRRKTPFLSGKVGRARLRVVFVIVILAVVVEYGHFACHAATYKPSRSTAAAFVGGAPSRRRQTGQESGVTNVPIPVNHGGTITSLMALRRDPGDKRPHQWRQRQGTGSSTESRWNPLRRLRSSLTTSPTAASSSSNEEEEEKNEKDVTTSTKPIRSRVKDLAKGLISRPLAVAATVPMPGAIAEVLKDASLAAVEQAVDEISLHSSTRKALKEVDPNTPSPTTDTNTTPTRESTRKESEQMIVDIIEEAFQPMEDSLNELEEALQQARASMEVAKGQSREAIEAIQVAAWAQAEGAATAVAQAEKVAEQEVLKELYSNAFSDVDVSNLTFEDVDYASSEMSPPFLDPDSCLIPGKPIVRVEKALENSRRIFAGIDILAGVDDVWHVLTDYANLQNVVPNLVVNEVLTTYDASSDDPESYDAGAPAEVQCKQVANKMKGSLLKQVGGAKVVGINFSAKTTLEVREWPQGMPDFAHFTEDMYEGKSRETRAQENANMKLQRYRFPRPFALSSLPTRDISMQSTADDDGEFRLYQGVWRMQPLPGCAPPGQQAMRLTYAVEISPRAYLPVRLVEGRIVADLCTNLEAIRDAVSRQ